MEELNIDREVLFFRYAMKIASPGEKHEVEKLIADSPELAAELEKVCRVARLQQQKDEMESCDVPAMFRQVENGIRRIDRRKRFITNLSRVAAVLALPLLISTVMFAYKAFRDAPERQVMYNEIAAAPGVVSHFELPDKSKVWLNSGSMLRYPNPFTGDVREVELEGEGYFEVQSDREHPFYVSTSAGLKVMAYGTAFNVNTEGNTIETTLAEGKVALMHTDRKVADLTPGNQAGFDRKSGKVWINNINLQEKLAWKDGKIIFRNAPLDEVFRQLSRRYNVDIVLHDEHKQSDRYRSRVTFTHETIQQIFSYLEAAAPIEWKMSSPVQNNDSTLTRQRIDVWLMKEK